MQTFILLDCSLKHHVITKSLCAGFTVCSNPVTPDEWETFSDINICKAEKQRTNSVSLRSLVESLLQQTATDMSMQHEATGNALEMNVQRIKSSKAMLEDHLSKV